MMSLSKIGIIGVGTMGSALVGRMLGQKKVAPQDLLLHVRHPERVAGFVAQGAQVVALDRFIEADVIWCCVKPQQLAEVLEQLRPVLRPDTLIVSIAAAISLPALEQRLPDGQPILRVMPNTPLKIGAGTSLWCGNVHVTPVHIAYLENILATMGQAFRCRDEAQLDALTPITGCGPAYLFYLAEILGEIAVGIGLDAEAAEALVRQTLIGSAALLAEEKQSFTTLKSQVTSRGGLTEAALATLAEREFAEALHAAVQAAARRNEALLRAYT